MKMKPHRRLHSMYIRVVSLIALLLSMVGAQDATFSVAGRTIQQRADLCTRSTQIKSAWDKLGDFPGGYPLQTKPSTDWGRGRCLEKTSEATGVHIYSANLGGLFYVQPATYVRFVEFCRTTRASLFNWRKHPSAPETLLYWGNDALLYRNTIVGYAYNSPIYFDNSMRASDLKPNFQPMICDCVTTFEPK